MKIYKHPYYPMIMVEFPMDETTDLPMLMDTIERHMIEQALQDTRGCTSKAALRLTVKRTTLVEKIKRLGIDKEKFH